MGLLDDLAGKAQGLFGECGEEGSLLKGVVEMLSDKEEGGLAGLVQSFQQKGLGEVISSWISTGQNLPISPEQIKEGFGSEALQTLAAKTGISTEEATAKLSELMPHLVDKMTPDGVIPEGGVLEKGLDFLKSKLV
ncbi:YidB family protein [Geomonas sp.]|uniref:YidB family protein n=1 Tax=Geomonas sp. TaxID=2651584 RepID=UPI0039C8695D